MVGLVNDVEFWVVEFDTKSDRRPISTFITESPVPWCSISKTDILMTRFFHF